MAGDLLALAAKYVALTGQIEDVRRAMLACLANGAGGAGEAPRPTQARSKPGGLHHNVAKAAEAERQIIELLRATPNLKTTEVAKATGAKTPTTVERLRRLRAKGLIERDSASAGWTASA